MKRINLIPDEAKKSALGRRLKDFVFKSAFSRVAASVVIFFMLIVFWRAGLIIRYKVLIAGGKNSIKALQAKLVDAQAEYADLRRQRQGVEKETGSIAGKLNMLKAIRAQDIAWASILERLSRLLPDNLWVNKVVLNNDSVTIVGATFDNSIVSKFMSGLDDSGYFKDTGFTYTKKTEMGDRPVIDFEVNTHLVLEKAMR